jgi:ubiquinone/menaquinone biosynthesis C-methylase UbiE
LRRPHGTLPLQHVHPVAYAEQDVGGDCESPSACGVGDPKLEAIAHLLRRRFGRRQRVLAVGCGDGTEAAVLADLMDADITGVDILDRFHPGARRRVKLVAADARRLPFPESSFDVVFSFHALEHIPQAHEAVAEMRRVVRPKGGFWIGAPNRSRLLGYLGSRDASARHKVLWNLNDWWARLRGRFRNELGAHAGFTSRELRRMLESEFQVVQNETSAYYARLYPRYRWLLAALERLGLDRLVYPSIYFAGSGPKANGVSLAAAVHDDEL